MLRMMFEDHLDSLEERMTLALENKRKDIAREFGCNEAVIDSLTVEEISDVVTLPVMQAFFGKYPQYRNSRPDNQRLMHGLLDHWKVGIFLSQFPDTVKAMVQTFAYRVESMSRDLNDRDENVLALRKLLKSAEIFNDHRQALRDLRNLACKAAITASERNDPLRCRELLQMVCVSAYVVDFGSKTTEIRTVANDNNIPQFAAAPTV